MRKGLALLGYRGEREVYDARIDHFLELWPQFDLHYVCCTPREREVAAQMEHDGQGIFERGARWIEAHYTYDSLRKLSEAAGDSDVSQLTIVTSTFHVPRARMLAGYAFDGCVFDFSSPEYPSRNYHMIGELFFYGLNKVMMVLGAGRSKRRREKKAERDADLELTFQPTLDDRVKIISTSSSKSH